MTLPMTQCKNAGSFLPSLIPTLHQLSNPASFASAVPPKSVPSFLFPMHLPLSNLPLLLASILLQQVCFSGPLHISVHSWLTCREYSSIYFPLIHQSIILLLSLKDKLTPPLTLVYIPTLVLAAALYRPCVPGQLKDVLYYKYTLNQCLCSCHSLSAHLLYINLTTVRFPQSLFSIFPHSTPLIDNRELSFLRSFLHSKL